MLTIDTRAVTRFMVIVAACLILASIGVHIARYVGGYDRMYGIIPLLNVNSEQNIPTLYSTALMITAGLLLWAMFKIKVQQSAPYARTWLLLSVVFFLLAVDEAWSFHERLIEPFNNLHGMALAPVFHFSWIIPAMLLVLVLWIIIQKVVRSLPCKTRDSFYLSALIFLSGAVGCEMLQGIIYEGMGGKDYLSYAMVANLEEGLEMTGLIIFIRSLLDYPDGIRQGLHIRFSSGV